MADFTPDELERYKEWAESLKGPQMSSLDEALEAQREAQAVAELTARGTKSAEKPLATLGEMVESVPKATPTLSPAAQSAQVFQKAGELPGERTLSKKQIEDYVKGLSKPGRVAAESAEVLAGVPRTARESADVFKQAGELSSEKTLNKKQTEELIKKLSKGGKTAEESAKILSEIPPARLSAQVFEEAGSALPKNIAEDIVKKASIAGKSAEESAKIFSQVSPAQISAEAFQEAGLSKFLPSLESVSKGATALGAAASAYDFSKGNLIEGGLTGLETLLGNVAPRVAVPLELLRPTATVSQEEEQAELDKLKRSNLLANLQKRGLAEESIGNNDELSLKKLPQLDHDALEKSKTDTTIPIPQEIKSIKQQKAAPVTKSSVSSGVGEKESLEAKLSEAIKAESEQAKKPEMDFNEMLRMAQESRDKSQLLANIGKASELFATGLTGTVPMGRVTKPVAQEYYDKLIKQAEQPVEDVGDAFTMKAKQDEMQRLARRRDPDSEESKFARDLLKQQGITIPEQATADALEKYAPQLTNILNQREARERREAVAKIAAAEREERKQATAKTKEDETMNKEFTQMSKTINSELASSRSSFGKSAGILRSAEAIETFIKGVDPKSITTRQIYELARSLDSMLSQGASTISGAKKLIPETMSGDTAKIAEYITSIPKGAGQEAFVKQMMETVRREKELAKSQVQTTQKKLLSGYSHLKKKDPERFNDILTAYELPNIEQESSKSLEEIKTKNQIKLPKDKRNVPGRSIEYSGKRYIIDPSGESATEE